MGSYTPNWVIDHSLTVYQRDDSSASWLARRNAGGMLASLRVSSLLAKPFCLLQDYIYSPVGSASVCHIHKEPSTIPPKQQKREAKSSNNILLYLATALLIAIISAFYRPSLSQLSRKITSKRLTQEARHPSTMSAMQFKFRPSETRGSADHGWLKVSSHPSADSTRLTRVDLPHFLLCQLAGYGVRFLRCAASHQ